MRKIFTFASNLAGRHGKGSAKEAIKNHGAIYGKGYGLQGSSFAIPTKDAQLKILPLSMIQKYVNKFLDFADNHMLDMEFELVAIGCGLAGYKPEEIAPMLQHHPRNVKLPKEFLKVFDEC